jgi:hypothetical protein
MSLPEVNRYYLPTAIPKGPDLFFRKVVILLIFSDSPFQAVPIQAVVQIQALVKKT